jgi:hypothetical protein
MTLTDVELPIRILAELAIIAAVFLGWGWRRGA